MAQLLVRDVPRDVVDALKRRAADNGRSAEAEHRAILEQALSTAADDFWDSAKGLRDQLHGRTRPDSAEIIREDRDRR